MLGFDWLNKIWQPARCAKRGALFAETIHVGYVEGKEFRFFYDFSLTDGQTKVIKFVSPVNFTIHQERISLLEGEIKFQSLTGGSEGGSFSESVPIFGKNRQTDRPTPNYETQVVITAGGTHTGGTADQVIRNKVSGNANFATSVGYASSDVRGYPPGTYYLRLLATGTTRGVLDVVFEERVWA